MTTTMHPAVLRSARPSGHAVPWPHASIARATGVVAGLAAVLGAVAVSRPKAPANTFYDLAYPLGVLPFVVMLALVARGLARRHPEHAWTRLAGVAALGWAVNAGLVAARSLTDGPADPHALTVGVGWVEDWAYLVPDFLVLVGLVLVLPRGRLTGAWRAVALVVGAGIALQVLVGFAGPGTLDDTRVANPLGLSVLDPVRHARDWGFFAFGALGLLAALVRQALAATRGTARAAGRLGLGAAVLVVVAFASSGGEPSGLPGAFAGFAVFDAALIGAALLAAAAVRRS